VALHVPGPTFDDVAVGIGDIERPAAIVVLERDDLGLVAVFPQACNRTVEIIVADAQCEVNVEAAASVRDSELRPPQPDSRLGARHEPDPPAVLPPVHDREPEHPGVERLGGRKVDDLQNKLTHTVHPNAACHLIPSLCLHCNQRVVLGGHSGTWLGRASP
jgi:hypothetical protein